jgi:pimeloyl-ACP methyl ester carboxylesterase
MNPILLLHGALGSEKQLYPIQQALEKEGFVVHTLNFSGHGGKPFRNNFGIEAFAADVHSFLDQNKIHTADIFGYSMGGYVAVWLAHLYPAQVGRIVTLGTKFDWSVTSAAHEVGKMNPLKIIEKVPAFARLLETRHTPNDWKVLMNMTAHMMTQLGAKPLLDEPILRSIKCKILILLGELDDMADKNFSIQTANLLNAEFRLLEKTPHPIEKVDVALIVSLLSAFFKK